MIHLLGERLPAEIKSVTPTNTYLPNHPKKV